MTFLIMLVMLVVLSACISTLLPGVDPAGRAIASAAAGVCVLTLVAQAMLSFGVWSPAGGLVVTGALCVLAAVGGRLLRPRRPRPAGPPPALPESAKITRHDGIPLPPRPGPR